MRPVTSCVTSAMIAIGTAKARTTTTISCFGVLMGEECWSCTFMASKFSGALSGAKRGQSNLLYCAVRVRQLYARVRAGPAL